MSREEKNTLNLYGMIISAVYIIAITVAVLVGVYKTVLFFAVVGFIINYALYSSTKAWYMNIFAWVFGLIFATASVLMAV